MHQQPPDVPEHVPSSPRRSRWSWIGLALAVALVAVAAYWARPGPESAGADLGIVTQIAPANGAAAELATAPETGNLAPNFRLHNLAGEEVLLSDLRGRPVFLNFWATWCFSCITEMPAMQRLADRYGEDVIVIGVNVGQSAEVAREFAAREEIRYPLLLDLEQEVTKAFGVRAMPTSLFIDRYGVVSSVNYGVLFPSEMEERLDPLVAQAG
ncbi:MAG: TlpA family protein disulfide reductase [Chloroflexota bacterium]|nr:TlpA family protein disulfide reductase [Chloroflexota bacterium]